jgi:hypothetical protein
VNFACARWLLFIFLMPPLHRSQFDGQIFTGGPQRPVVIATFDGLKPATLRLRYQDALHSDAGHNAPAPTLDEFGRYDF